MIDEREALNLLEVIRSLALLGFPYDRDSSTINADIVLTLEEISRLANTAIGEHASPTKGRPWRGRDRTVDD